GQDVSETQNRVANAVGACERNRSQWRRQGAGKRPRERRADAGIRYNRADAGLAAENRCGEGVHRQRPAEIGRRVEGGAPVCVEIDGDATDRDLARPRYVGSGRYAGVIVVGLEQPARLQRSCREAPEEAWYPETHAAFIGKRRLRTSASATAKAPVEIRRVRCARLVRDVACDAVHVVVRSMSTGRPSTRMLAA